MGSDMTDFPFAHWYPCWYSRLRFLRLGHIVLSVCVYAVLLAMLFCPHIAFVFNAIKVVYVRVNYL